MEDCLLAEFVADYPEDDDRHVMARELIELRALCRVESLFHYAEHGDDEVLPHKLWIKASDYAKEWYNVPLIPRPKEPSDG